MATNNLHKLEEVKNALGSDITVLSLQDIHCWEELAEDGNTLEANSLQKANYIFTKYGVACFADDSGLEVESLNGEPGVYSARYAGPQRSSEDNMRLLLQNLATKQNRKAQFRAVITLIHEKGTFQFEGKLPGSIIHEQRGSSGFGYDPLFQPEGFSKTLAEMTLAEKNAISHRAIAVKKLSAFIQMNRW